jgi:uncharacterized protein (DUF697 family)
MNQSTLLHVVERLEGFVAKLPAGIQKPILAELNPLKELFLQQRPPRFLFSGSAETPLPQIVDRMFAPATPFAVLAERFRWQRLNLPERGRIAVLDARETPPREIKIVEEELAAEPPDVIVFVGNEEHLRELRPWISTTEAKFVAVNSASADGDRLRDLINAEAELRDRSLGVFVLERPEQSQMLMSILSAQMPNQARIEMIRISPDRAQQQHVADILIRSTSAICTAVGAQPIPLADMPILTTLQLMMVSAIMYISGRERSLRAATEFAGAVGANLSAGMLLREGTRAILKFFPGWGNVVSGMVAGAGTYAIGRAASAYFLDNVSLKDARRTYRLARRHAPLPELPDEKPVGRRRTRKTRAPGTSGGKRGRIRE